MSSVLGKVKCFTRKLSKMACSCSSSSLLMFLRNESSCRFEGEVALPCSGRFALRLQTTHVSRQRAARSRNDLRMRFMDSRRLWA